MNPHPTLDTTAMVTATLTGIIPGTAELFIDQDAATGSPEWYVAVAAANLRDAAKLLYDCLQDTGHPTISRRAGQPVALTEDPDDTGMSTVELRDTLRDWHGLSTEDADQWARDLTRQYNAAAGDQITGDHLTGAQARFLLDSAAALICERAALTEDTEDTEGTAR